MREASGALFQIIVSMRRSTCVIALLAVLAFAVLLFFPALFQGRILAPLDISKTMLAPWSAEHPGAKPRNHYAVDAVTQYLPYRIFAERSLKEDGYIGWNPYEMGGVSLAENTMALPGTWTMQLHRFLGFKEAWNLGLLLEFLIAGSGMLVFLKDRRLPVLACLLGAIAYMANSQFVIWIHHRWALGSFCWMPWVLWALADGLRWRVPPARLLLAPLFLALAFMGGTLQHAAFVVIACGCLFAGGVRDWRKPIAEVPAAFLWAAALLIALLISGFTVIPQVQAYFTNISMGHTRGGIGYEKGLLQPVFQAFLILCQIWPWLMGDPSTIDGFRLIKCGFMDLAYLGTLPMLLALAGVFRRGMPSTAKWLILAGLLIPLTPLVGPLYHRVQLLFLLGGAWMAAEMVADLLRRPSALFSRWLPVAVGALGLLLLAGALLPGPLRKTLEDKVVAQSLQATSKSSLAADRAWIEARARRWTSRLSLTHPRTAWTYGLLVCGTLGAAALSSRNRQGSRLAPGLILVATSLELATFFHAWCTFSDPADLQPGHPTIERTRELAGESRVLQRADGATFTDIFATPNLLAGFFIPSVDAYESIQYPSTSHVLAEIAPDLRLGLAGVGLSVQPKELPPAPGTADWPVLAEESGYAFRRNPRPIAPLLAGTGDLPAAVEPLPGLLASATAVKPMQRTMNRLEFENPQNARWVRVSMNWHPGWKWRTPGGDWQATLKGPDAATWIDLTGAAAGRVEMRFFPRPAGLAPLSLACAAVLAAAFALFSLRKRSALPIPPPDAERLA